ncbi:hypothetical protein PAEPH01_1751 [Pancytospora epiphaga]|nr:hypothetical protein PAEPH01_1751 [Pancytospora epiphaga]
MLKFMVWLYAAGVLALTFIIPKGLPNHRLTYTNGPRIINSAVDESTKVEDYFSIPSQITNLFAGNKTMCKYDSKSLHTCSAGSLNEVFVEIKDRVREVQFSNIMGECLTIGAYDGENDSYDVFFDTCKDGNPDQLFILNKDQGHIGRRTYDRNNIRAVYRSKI